MLSYPLIAVAVSLNLCRMRLVYSEEEHIRFVQEFYERATLILALDPAFAFLRRY